MAAVNELTPAASVEQSWFLVQNVSKELIRKLEDGNPSIDEIELLIHRLRSHSETTVFLDFDFASSHGLDNILWESHSRINVRYRKIVASFTQIGAQKKNVVERRKWEKRYVDFLKTAQYFYKGYIQRLASHFAGLFELRRIAQTLNLSTLNAEQRVKVSPETAHKILMSCHFTLLRIGDLYRYRNVLRTKDRSWDMAMAHYDLANNLYPYSGEAFAQMAVISLLDKDDFHTIYQLYRALAIKEPSLLAQMNLETEFRKIINSWERPNNRPTSHQMRFAAIPTPLPVVLWFNRLHAKLYKGEDFVGYDELENEVLSQMTVLLKENSLKEVLNLMVLINIAAQYCAGAKQDVEPGEQNFARFCRYLRFNVRMFFMLCQVLQPELDDHVNNDTLPDVTQKSSHSHSGSLSLLARQLLPVLRHYSTWLISSAANIVAFVGNSSLNVHITQMWSMYATTLTFLAAAFPPEDLPTLNYLLEEDAQTIGFKPFRGVPACDIYVKENEPWHGELKPRYDSAGVERCSSDVEMHFRVRGLLRDGMVLSVNDNYPLYVSGAEFRIREDGIPTVDSVLSDHPLHPSEDPVQCAVAENIKPGLIEPIAVPRPPSVAPSDSHQSMSTDMYQMVDDLVTPSYQLQHTSPTNNRNQLHGLSNDSLTDPFSSSLLKSRPTSNHTTTPAYLTGFSGSGIWGVPFTPQSGNLNSISPDHPLGSITNPATPERDGNLQQYNDFALQPKQMGLSSPNSCNAWGTPVSKGPISRPNSRHSVGWHLQQSLAQQYSPLSDFSQLSSAYQNTSALSRRKTELSRGLGINQSNDTTVYAGASAFDTTILLQSSIWDGSHPIRSAHGSTPPGGQRG